MARQVIHAQSTKREYRKFIGVLLFIAFAASLMSTLVSISVSDWIRWYVGSSLVVFGGAKLISYESFLEVFPQYDAFASRHNWYAYVFPVVEVFLGIFYILDIGPDFMRYILTSAWFVYTFLGVSTNLDRLGPSKDYTWLGKAFRLPMSSVLLFESAILASLTAVLVVMKVVGWVT